MVPFIIAVAAIGIVGFRQTGALCYLLEPIVIVPLWVMLRLHTPREGMLDHAICSTPGGVVMLSSIAGAPAILVLLIAIDVFVFHHSFGYPLQPYQVGMFAFTFILMLIGACWAGRIAWAQSSSVGEPPEDAQSVPQMPP
ncbi:MAG TPA: hypothetical protein VHC22_12310 [Pirellulales bacterium]|nr:hypothetical protein [Pirellulales bacterium]